MMRQLEHYKKRSPFYADAVEVIHAGLNVDTRSIVQLNKNILIATCAYIGLPLQIDVFSEMKLVIEPVNSPGEWALNITKALGGDEYINPTGGIEIFDKAQYDAAGIRLKFLGNNLPAYPQRREVFEPGLSIIDAMMFNSPEQIRALINDTRWL
jgi:hypothetical protein